MDAVYVPLFSALAGAVIGSATSIVTLIVQARSTARRERTRLAVEAAIADHNAMVEFVKGHRGTVRMLPLSAAIIFHADLLEMAERGRITPELLRELQSRQEQIGAVIVQSSAEQECQRRSTDSPQE